MVGKGKVLSRRQAVLVFQGRVATQQTLSTMQSKRNNATDFIESGYLGRMCQLFGVQVQSVSRK